MPQASRRALIAQVHIAKKNMGLDDDTYRLWLARETGKSSCRDLSMTALRSLVESCRRGGHLDDKTALSPERPTPAQRRCLAALAKAKGWEGGLSDKRLRAFIRRTTGVEHMRFLTRRQASDVITGLKQWSGAKGDRKQAG